MNGVTMRFGYLAMGAMALATACSSDDTELDVKGVDASVEATVADVRDLSNQGTGGASKDASDATRPDGNAAGGGDVKDAAHPEEESSLVSGPPEADGSVGSGGGGAGSAGTGGAGAGGVGGTLAGGHADAGAGGAGGSAAAGGSPAGGASAAGGSPAGGASAAGGSAAGGASAAGGSPAGGASAAGGSAAGGASAAGGSAAGGAGAGLGGANQDAGTAGSAGTTGTGGMVDAGDDAPVDAATTEILLDSTTDALVDGATENDAADSATDAGTSGLPATSWRFDAKPICVAEPGVFCQPGDPYDPDIPAYTVLAFGDSRACTVGGMLTVWLPAADAPTEPEYDIIPAEDDTPVRAGPLTGAVVKVRTDMPTRYWWAQSGKVRIGATGGKLTLTFAEVTVKNGATGETASLAANVVCP